MEEELIKQGWQQFNSHLKPPNCTGYYKSFEGHKSCNYNKKNVKQVEIYITNDPKAGKFIEVECCGQLVDESWIRCTFLGIKNNSLRHIEKKIENILKIWDYATEQS